MKPILLDWPDCIETPRLVLRVPRAGGGAQLNAAIVESLADLRAWMPWAQEAPTLDESEEYCRSAHAKFLAREDMGLQLFLRDGFADADRDAGGQSTLIGGSGLHLRDWSVPSFEIGYWCRPAFQGQGYISEAVRAITQFGFEVAGAQRLMIRCDSQNTRSRRVAERCGFSLDGELRNDGRSADGTTLRSTLVFSMLPDKRDAAQA
ncbi:MAG: hypothetical protein JWN98_2685 [Abditibacteriota bacterium]|nr:hypothetical protein [Abditibacteriota bacterium]